MLTRSILVPDGGLSTPKRSEMASKCGANAWHALSRSKGVLWRFCHAMTRYDTHAPKRIKTRKKQTIVTNRDKRWQKWIHTNTKMDDQRVTKGDKGWQMVTHRWQQGDKGDKRVTNGDTWVATGQQGWQKGDKTKAGIWSWRSNLPPDCSPGDSASLDLFLGGSSLPFEDAMVPGLVDQRLTKIIFYISNWFWNFQFKGFRGQWFETIKRKIVYFTLGLKAPCRFFWFWQRAHSCTAVSASPLKANVANPPSDHTLYFSWVSHYLHRLSISF